MRAGRQELQRDEEAFDYYLSYNFLCDYCFIAYGDLSVKILGRRRVTPVTYTYSASCIQGDTYGNKADRRCSDKKYPIKKGIRTGKTVTRRLHQNTATKYNARNFP